MIIGAGSVGAVALDATRNWMITGAVVVGVVALIGTGALIGSRFPLGDL